MLSTAKLYGSLFTDHQRLLFNIIIFSTWSRCYFWFNFQIFSVVGVGHVIIPSVQELTEMWERKCGFSPIEDAVSQKIINWNTLTFPSAVRLQKALLWTPDGSPSAVMNADVGVDEGVDMVRENCAKLSGLDLNHEYTESGDEEAENKWHNIVQFNHTPGIWFFGHLRDRFRPDLF